MNVAGFVPRKVHTFQERKSHSESAGLLPFWNAVYKKAFPNLNHVEPCNDEYWQRRGVDKVIYLNNGHTLHIDEKSRDEVYPDIALEYLSSDTTGAAGWIEKDLNIDFLAYAFLPIRKCYLLPWMPLRLAWLKYGQEWRSQYFIVKAYNPGYITYSVAVPIDILLGAIKASLIVEV